MFFSRRYYREVRDAAMLEWAQDVTRHSYGSYHLGAFQNAGKTAESMGHKGTAMLYKHYREPMPEADAAPYWQIAPKASSGSVIRMQSACFQQGGRFRSSQK